MRIHTHAKTAMHKSTRMYVCAYTTGVRPNWPEAFRLEFRPGFPLLPRAARAKETMRELSRKVSIYAIYAAHARGPRAEENAAAGGERLGALGSLVFRVTQIMGYIYIQIVTKKKDIYKLYIYCTRYFHQAARAKIIFYEEIASGFRRTLTHFEQRKGRRTKKKKKSGG